MSKEIDTIDLPKSMLQKSLTYTKWAHKDGRCSVCHEMTNILMPCCNGSIQLEGVSVDPDTLWNTIEEELCIIAQDQHENQTGDEK